MIRDVTLSAFAVGISYSRFCACVRGSRVGSLRSDDLAATVPDSEHNQASIRSQVAVRREHPRPSAEHRAGTVPVAAVGQPLPRGAAPDLQCRAFSQAPVPGPSGLAHAVSTRQTGQRRRRTCLSALQRHRTTSGRPARGQHGMRCLT